MLKNVDVLGLRDQIVGIANTYMNEKEVPVVVVSYILKDLLSDLEELLGSEVKKEREREAAKQVQKEELLEKELNEFIGVHEDDIGIVDYVDTREES